MTNTFEIGKSYYDVDGHKVELIAFTDDARYVVSKTMQVEYYDDVYYEQGETCILDRLFSLPPKEVVDSEVAALRKEKERLTALNSELRTQAHLAERDVADRIKRLKKYEALELVDDFLEKRTTHFLIEEYYDYKIVDLDGLKDDDKWSPQFRMISLFGKNGGDPEWRICRYSDGSGNDWKHIIPCLSEDDAKQRRVKLITDSLNASRASLKANTPYWTIQTVNAALKHGIPVPDDLLDARNKYEQKAINNKRKRAQQNIERHQKEIDEADAAEAALCAAVVHEFPSPKGVA
ncbi:MAG TPA: hypothetical protein VKA31_03820 [Mariprofundaceae bacterium]|nr:hypothetical protein [Mariprofundaceae bacterium]